LILVLIANIILRGTKHLISLYYNFLNNYEFYLELMSFYSIVAFVSFIVSVVSIDNFLILSKGEKYSDNAYKKYFIFYILFSIFFCCLAIPTNILFKYTSTKYLIIIILTALFMNINNLTCLYYRVMDKIWTFFIFSILPSIILLFIVVFVSFDSLLIKIFIGLSFLPGALVVFLSDLENYNNMKKFIKSTYKEIYNHFNQHSLNIFIHTGGYSIIFALMINLTSKTFSTSVASQIIYSYQINSISIIILSSFIAYWSVRVIKDHWKNKNKIHLLDNTLKKMASRIFVITILTNISILLFHYYFNQMQRIDLFHFILFMLAACFNIYNVLYISIMTGIGAYDKLVKILILFISVFIGLFLLIPIINNAIIISILFLLFSIIDTIIIKNKFNSFIIKYAEFK
jgi:hypothetical protein